MIKSSQFIALKSQHSFTPNLFDATAGMGLMKDRGETFSHLGDRNGRRPFSPMEGLLSQKPGGNQRKRLMVIPTLPGSHFIVSQSRLTFGALQRIFDSMFCLYNSPQFLKGSFRWRVGKKVVLLPSSIVLPAASHHQEFLLRANGPLFRSGNDTGFNHLKFQGSFVTPAYGDLLPSFFRKRVCPMLKIFKSTLRGTTRTPKTTHGSRSIQIPDGGIERYGKQIPFSLISKRLAKPFHMPHFIISGNPGMGQMRPVSSKHFKRQFMAGLVTNLFGNTAFFASLLVPGPFFGKVQACVNEHMLFFRRIGHVHTHLPIVNFAKSANPLAGYAYRILALLFKSRGVENDDSGRLPNFGCDFTHHGFDQRLVIPRSSTNKVLKTMTIFAASVRNRLDVLSLKIRHQSSQVKLRVDSLFFTAKMAYILCRKSIQTLYHIIENLRCNFTLSQHFLLVYLESSLHP